MPNNPITIPAASALVLRDHPEHGIEVLLVKRASASRSFADLWVFPGGKVDPTDRALAHLLASEARSIAHAEHKIATWRELHEETGGDAAMSCDPGRLRSVLPTVLHWAHWRAPDGAPQAFDTQFFLLDAQCLAHEPRPDGHEITELRWQTPAQAAAEFMAGSLAAAPPTGFNLIELAAAAAIAGSTAGLLRQESGRAICCIHPRLDRRSQPHYSIFPWDPDYASLGADQPTASVEVPPRYRLLPSRLPVQYGTFAKS